MICKKILLLVCIAASAELIEAKSTSNLVAQSLKSMMCIAASAKAATLKGCMQVKEITITQAKNLQDKFKVSTNHNSTTTFQGENKMPGIAQAAKNDGDVVSRASGGWIGVSRSTNATTNNVVHNHNYAKKTFSESFFDWVQNGGQTRAAGAGFTVGAAGGYGLHAAVTPKEKEKIIVVQAQSEKN